MPNVLEDYSYLLVLRAGLDDDLIMMLRDCRFGERRIILKKALRLYKQSQVSTADLMEELLFIQEQLRDIQSRGVYMHEDEALEDLEEVPIDEKVHNALMEFGI
jgi:uncharacterized protein (DUF2336 family)